MIKLFSMFVRYAQLPHKQFLRVSSSKIFSLAESAEQQGKGLEIAAYEDSLSIRAKGHEIIVEAFPNTRQLIYRSSLSPYGKYSWLGSRWVDTNQQDISDAFQKDLQQLIKQ